MNRTRQFRVRLGGLGGHDDLGAVLRGLQRDRLADAAARPGDVKGLARQLPGKKKTRAIKICLRWTSASNSSQFCLSFKKICLLLACVHV